MRAYKIKRPEFYSTHIYFDVFKSNIWLVECEDIHQALKFMGRNDDRKFVFDYSPNAEASVYSLEVNGQFVPCIVLPFKWKNTDHQISILSHEVIHAVIMFFRSKQLLLPGNIDKESNDEELFCYHVGYVMEKCLKFLNGQKKPLFFSDEMPININSKPKKKCLSKQQRKPSQKRARK